MENGNETRKREGREGEREREREREKFHTHFDVFLQFTISSLLIGRHYGKLFGGKVHHLTFDY